MKKKNEAKASKRIIFAFGIIIALFIALIVRLIILQIFEADELSQKQEAFTYKKINITASRGDIYDRNMNVLAMDAACSKVSAFPSNVTDPEGTAAYLSQVLGMDYQSVYNKLTDTSVSFVNIKRSVDNTSAQQIEDADLSGIVVSDDQKRYYSDSTFAQYVLGFTGVDHVGLYGIEAVYNNVLKGEAGVETVLSDSAGRELQSNSTVQKEATPGNNVVLTIDSVMQYYAEEAVYNAYKKNDAKRVIAIVSDPNTGEILAMAAYPTYDLSDPWTISSDYASAYASDMNGLSTGDKQLEMWQNPFTSFIYEPGSTYKVITTSAALEENIVTLQSTFYCNGYLEVGGIKIKCWIYPGKHGTENLTQAVSNSCNVAMMDIAKQMGPDIFYQYMYAYGFGQLTGIDLDGEESGILSPNNGEVNLVDFVTLSFGQGLGVTPVQVVQALNASINGGLLMKPMVAKYVLDHDTNEIITSYEPTVVRRVISDEVSNEMQAILKYTADNNSAISKYSALQMGGKTGTAQKYINGSYAAGRYVASFYGFAPYDNPKLSVIVIVDEPGGALTTGSSVASPIGAEILQNCLEYLNSTSGTSTDVSSASTITVPDIRGKTVAEAKSVLDTLGIAYSITGSEDGIVTDQNQIKSVYTEGMNVAITSSSTSGDSVLMPNMIGMSLQNANEILSALGLTLQANGGGIAASQSIAAGTTVPKGTAVAVNFSYIE